MMSLRFVDTCFWGEDTFLWSTVVPVTVLRNLSYTDVANNSGASMIVSSAQQVFSSQDSLMC